MPSSFPRPAVPMLIGAAACWGVGTVLTKQVLSEVAPLTLLPVQLLASCLFLAAVSRAGRTGIVWSPQLRRLAALGILNPGLSYALGLLGLVSITASMSVLLWATEPVFILLLAVLVLRERLPLSLAALMMVAMAGVLLVVHQPGASGAGTGIVLTLAAVSACGLYTVLARRLLLDDSSLSVALVQQAVALGFAVVLVGAAEVTFGDALSPGSLSLVTWLAAAASGVLYYGLAFWLYLTGLRTVPASVAGAFITLVPVFGVAAGYVVGESLTGRQWVGAALVVAAMAVVAVRPAGVRASPARPR